MCTIKSKNTWMDTWNRVDKRLRAERREWKELGAAIGCTASQMGNWAKRGIPAKHHAAIAAFFKEPIEWVIGASSITSWPFDLVDRDDYESLPLPSRHAVQVRMQDAIEKEMAKLAEKQEIPNKASRAA